MLLTASPRTYYVVQYWESKEKLLRVRVTRRTRSIAWRGPRFNRRMREGKAGSMWGFWHETYVVPEGSYESIYVEHARVRSRGGYGGRCRSERRGRSAKERFADRPG